MSTQRKTWIGLAVLASAALLMQPVSVLAVRPSSVYAEEEDVVLLRVRAAAARRYAAMAPWYQREYGVDASAALWGPPYNLAPAVPTRVATPAVDDATLPYFSSPDVTVAPPHP